jgi:hypothetical protein
MLKMGVTHRACGWRIRVTREIGNVEDTSSTSSDHIGWGEDTTSEVEWGQIYGEGVGVPLFTVHCTLYTVHQIMLSDI